MFRSTFPASKTNGRTVSARRLAPRNPAGEKLDRAVALVEPLESRQLLTVSPAVTFTPPRDFSTETVSRPEAMVVADVNGDGKPDIVTLSQNGQVGILIGNGNGTFQTAQNVNDGISATSGGVDAQSLAVANYNGQEFIIASNNGYSKVSVLSANASGVWSVYGTYANQSNGSNINALTVADINGTPFLVTANQAGSVTYSQIEAGSGSEGFFGTEHTINAVITTGANGVTTAALVSLASGSFITGGNGSDLVVVGSNNKIAVLAGINSGGLSASGGGFTATPKSSGDTTTQNGITTASTVYNSASGNVLVKTTAGAIIPLVGNVPSSTSPFTVAPTITPAYSEFNVAVGDFNGDGATDFALVYVGNPGFSVFTGDGTGSYNSGGTFGYGKQDSYSAAAGDFNGDGESSVAVGYYNSGADDDGFVGVSDNTTPLAPSFTSDSTVLVKVGTVFDFTVKTDGVPSPKITETGGLPPGLSFKDNGDGTATITGKATSAANASYVLHLTAKNATDTATQTLTFHVSQIAVFTSPTQVTLTEGTAGAFVVKTTGGFNDGNVSALTAKLNGSTISAGSFVDGLTFTDHGDGTATLSGTPTTNGNLTLIVTDGAGSLAIQQAVKVIVMEKPTFGGDNSATFTVGTEDTTKPSDLDEEITTTGFPTPSISISSGSLPAGLKFKDNGDGTADISGEPAKGTGGKYILKLVAGNSAGSATNQPFTYTVHVTEAPVIVSPASATFTVGTAGQKFIVKATGNSGSGVPSFSSDVDSINGITSGSLPAGLTFHANADGTATISGTPAAGTGGVYTLTIATATDASDNSLPSTATQSFTLTIKEAPGFASATSSDTVLAGSAITPIVISRDKGFGTPKMTLQGGLPKGLTFTDNGNGTVTISGTPAATSGGIYKFNVKATNSAGNAAQKVTLQVDQAPEFSGSKTSKTIDATHGHAVNQTIGLQGFATPFGDLNNTGSGLTQNGLTVALNSAGTALTLTGTPTATATTTFTFTIDDHDGDTGPALTLTVDVA